MRQAQGWQLRYQQLQAANQQYPELQTRVQEVAVSLQARLSEQQKLGEQIEQINQQLATTANPQCQIQTLEEQIKKKEGLKTMIEETKKGFKQIQEATNNLFSIIETKYQ